MLVLIILNVLLEQTKEYMFQSELSLVYSNKAILVGVC